MIWMILIAVIVNLAAIGGWVELANGRRGSRGRFHDLLAQTLMASFFGPVMAWSVVIGLRGGL